MGKNVSIAPVFRTKSPHRGVILFRTVLQSAADLLISMLAGGKHTEIKEDAGPYNGANDNLMQLDQPEFEAGENMIPAKKEGLLHATAPLWLFKCGQRNRVLPVRNYDRIRFGILHPLGNFS